MSRQEKPFVSVLVPTRNRRIFIPQLLRNFRLQTYPHDRMELLVADDGDDCVADLFKDIKGVRYIRTDPVPLGKKRNILAEEACGDIMVHMDDDDYYHKIRVAHAVSRLMQSGCLLAGSTEMYIYDLFRGLITRSGPFHDRHATNATIAYKREYLKENRFDDEAVVSDEFAFTNGFTNPMVQLDIKSTMLCIQHSKNTWNKNSTTKQPTTYSLKDFVTHRESLSFYRYQLKKLILDQINTTSD